MINKRLSHEDIWRLETDRSQQGEGPVWREALQMQKRSVVASTGGERGNWCF